MTLKRIVSTLIITVFILALCGCKNQAGEAASTSNNLEGDGLQETDVSMETDEEMSSKIKLIGEGDYLVEDGMRQI